MSAFGGKTDHCSYSLGCPLLTQSGHQWLSSGIHVPDHRTKPNCDALPRNPDPNQISLEQCHLDESTRDWGWLRSGGTHVCKSMDRERFRRSHWRLPRRLISSIRPQCRPASHHRTGSKPGLAHSIFSTAFLITRAPTSWNTILRLYSPLESWFNKTWRPGEIEQA
jgi:hypothetical protein